MNYNQFLTHFYTVIVPQLESVRRGQALMNFLFDIWPEEYKRITSAIYYDETDIDCFDNNDLIPNTLLHLSNVWDKYPN